MVLIEKLSLYETTLRNRYIQNFKEMNVYVKNLLQQKK